MPKPQFSVRVLFLTIAVVGAVLGLMLQPPPIVALFAVTGVILGSLAFSVVGLVHGRNYMRPFCVGLLVPTALAFWCALRNQHWFLHVERFEEMVPNSDNPRWPAVLMGMMELAAIALGFFCVFVRWLMAKPLFSVGILLLTIALVGAILGLMLQPPPAVAAYAILVIILGSLAFSVVGLVYGGDYMRSFCIGLAVPLALAFYIASQQQHWFLQVEHLATITNANPRWPALLLGMMELAAIALGYFCVSACWLMDRPSDRP